MLKSPPLYDVDFVLHPEEDTSHVFFRDAADHPFQARPAGSISRVNAWWLAEASLAAYHAPARATAIFHAAGLHCEPLTAGPTEAYVTYGAEAVIVVFRGTTPDRWEAMVADTQMA